MGGSDSTRGYLVQAMILILDTLRNDNIWIEVSLEPKRESEKVDIKWLFPNQTKVVQVKSSINAFKRSEVENWCSELKDSTSADNYELVLVGSSPQSVIELSKTGFKGVEISYRNLDLDGMIKQIAHGVDIYCVQQGIPSRNPSARELLANALVAEFEKYSTEGKFVARSEFEELLAKWIFLLLPQINSLPDISSVSLVPPIYQSEPWWQTLLFDGDGEASTLQELLLVDDVKKIAVVGRSGSGKTSAMKMAAYHINRNTQHTAFWIPLRSYTVDLFTTIKRFLGWFDLPTDRVVRTLQQHNIVLFLDGVNEVPKDYRENCVSEIEQLISSYRGRLCVSCLITDKTTYTFGIETHEICPLDEVAINRAVNIYYQDDKSKRQFLLDLIMRSKHDEKGLFTLLQTPIYLSLFLELAESKDFEYKTYRDLYGAVIEKRLTKNVQRGKQDQIHINEKEDLLMGLAFRSLVEDRGMQMSKAFVRDTFSNLIQIDVDFVLDELIRSDLIINVGDSDIEWLHPSFRDYFAGRYLVNLVELDKPIDEFPFGEDRSVSAIAHAVKLSTHSLDLSRRYKIYLAFLKSNPTFGAIELVSAEYGVSKWIGDSKTLADAEREYMQYKWGERFLDAYQYSLKSLYQEDPLAKEQIPCPQGLIVFFTPQIDFCLMLFTDAKEVRFEKLEVLENFVYEIIKENKPCVGFCLYAPFMFMLDPEILAYVETQLLIKLNNLDVEKKNMFNGLPELVITPNDWISWGKITEPPEFKYQSGMLSNRVLLNWNDFYNPITFQIDPGRIKPRRLTSRSYTISLGLVMPFTPQNWHKIDLPNKIYVSFPVHLLDGYYVPDVISGNQSTGKLARTFIQFVHLEKI